MKITEGTYYKILFIENAPRAEKSDVWYHQNSRVVN